MTPEAGKVYLVGAGPGDPELISLKAVRCLRGADAVVYDYLASPELLSHAPEEAERIYVGKKGGDHTLPQDEIIRILVEKAREGKAVVRLKGGDPFVFGRGAEEAEVLAAEGIPFEVVPGITSAVAAPAYAGIPLTHRDFVSSVSFITGHEDPAKEESAIGWKGLASSGGTLVFLMGMKNLEEISGRLIESGMDPRTPAAVVMWGTTPSQRAVVGMLEDIPQKAREEGLRPPAIVVVGEIVTLREKLLWFEKRPLFGRNIIVTRAREQASALADALRDLGAQVIQFPTIEIVPPERWDDMDRAIGALLSYSWIIFTSANGVKCFFSRLLETGGDIRALGGRKVCAIGPATAAALKERGIVADMVPKEFRAEAVVEGFGGEDIEGKKILLPRAEEARELLPEELRAMGAEVDVVAAYRNVMPGGNTEQVRGMLRDRRVDMVTFTSSSTVRNFAQMIGQDDVTRLMEGVSAACIGPVTAETAASYGLKTDVSPTRYTIDSLVQSIVSHFSEG